MQNSDVREMALNDNSGIWYGRSNLVTRFPVGGFSLFSELPLYSNMARFRCQNQMSLTCLNLFFNSKS